MTEPTPLPPYPSDVPDMAVLPVRRPCLDRAQCIALALLIGGAVNLGIEGMFAVDPIATLLGPQSAMAMAVRIAIGLAGVYGIHLLILYRPAPRRR